VEIASGRARQLAALLVEAPDVRGVELRGESLVVRTRNPGRFFALVSDVVTRHEIEVDKLQTLDAGADAVFGYLQS
jgi:hypothetical protein